MVDVSMSDPFVENPQGQGLPVGLGMGAVFAFGTGLGSRGGGPGGRFISGGSDFVIGEIREWSAALATADWQLCDGTSLLVANFPELFLVLGYTFGGAGLNFSVPDIRGRGVIGVGTAVALGASDGLAEALRDPLNHDHPAGGLLDGVAVDPWTAMPLSLAHIWAGTTGLNGSAVEAQVAAAAPAAATGHAHTMTNTFDDHTTPDLDHLHTSGAITSLGNWPDHLGLNHVIRTAA